MNIVQGHIDFMNRYYGHYHRHFSEITKHGRSEEADQTWLNAVESLVGTFDGNQPVVQISDLEEVLALIHPDFYHNCKGYRFEGLDELSSEVFRNLARDKDLQCFHGVLTGTICIFQEANIQADHVWPGSLGGPRAMDNFMPLCREHNGMKANSIVLFTHSEVPGWLGRTLHRLRAHKMVSFLK